MLKHIVLATFLTCGAASAYGQTTPPSAPPKEAPARPPSTSTTAPTTTSSEPRMVSTGDFNVSGDMSASAILGAKVRNDARETVGKIDDIYLAKDGAIKTVIISVGGFLGVGAKAVAVKWSDIKFDREDKSLVLTTALTKDSLTAMPDYTAERRQPAPPDTAAAPPANATRPGGGTTGR